MEIPVVAMVLRSGWVARIILLLLAFFSLLTWTIIFNKLFHFGGMGALNKRLRSIFDEAHTISELSKMDPKVQKCPLGILGKIGVAEYRRIIDDARKHTGVKDWSFYLQSQFAMASERFGTATASLAARLDSGVFLLAIVSSVAPFLGLLGTVWGIMNSFYEIGNQGSASLPVVAPGIAEALITTIVGLAVAIPSVFFFNVFVHKAGRIEDEMGEFSEQFLMRLKSEIFNLLYGGGNAREPR